MRITKFFLLLLLISPFSGMADDTLPELVPVTLKQAFVPVGFDSNDQVQMVVTGEFPDGCYKTGPYRVTKTDAGILVQQFAYRYRGVCLDMMVPFSQVVDLGITPSANYPIADAMSGKRLGMLKVTVATSAAVDDYLYAPVNAAMILEGPGGAGPVLHLTGNYPSRFMRVKEIRVQQYDNVLVVQPIVEMFSGDLGGLLGGMHPRFEIKKELKSVPKGRFLLHVRAMDGRAINRIEEISENN